MQVTWTWGQPGQTAGLDGVFVMLGHSLDQFWGIPGYHEGQQQKEVRYNPPKAETGWQQSSHDMNTDPKWLTWATTGIQPLDLVELILGENKERAKNIYPVHIKHLIDNEDTEEIGWKHLKTIIATTKMEAKEQKETNRFSAIACG